MSAHPWHRTQLCKALTMVFLELGSFFVISQIDIIRLMFAGSVYADIQSTLAKGKCLKKRNGNLVKWMLKFRWIENECNSTFSQQFLKQYLLLEDENRSILGKKLITFCKWMKLCLPSLQYCEFIQQFKTILRETRTIIKIIIQCNNFILWGYTFWLSQSSMWASGLAIHNINVIHINNSKWKHIGYKTSSYAYF